MGQNYFSKNTDSFQFILNIVNSSSIFSKKKEYKIQSIITFLSLLMMFFFTGNTFAQTTIFSSGFEPNDATFSSIATGNTTILQPSPNIPRTGAKSCEMSAPKKSTLTGNIFSTNKISFVSGRYYTISVWAQASGVTSQLIIKKLTGNTLNDMNSAPVNDVLLDQGYNVTVSYKKISVTFQATVNENKHLGIQIYSSGAAGATPEIYLDDISIVENLKRPCESYCSSGGTDGTAGYISNVKFPVTGGIDRTSMWEGYACTGAAATVTQGNPYTLSVTKTITNPASVTAWIDWNGNGSYSDSGEQVMTYASNSIATQTQSITVPITSIVGLTKMRVMFKYNAPALEPCEEYLYMDVEDYDINITSSSSCSTPAAQPSSLSLTSIGNTISGSFTLASPAVDNYLVVVSNSATAPTPVAGTTYTVGSTALGGSNVVVDIDNNNTFAVTGLTGTTLYYVYVFSYNSLCSGGPLYRTTSPLNGSITTLTPTYCTPTGSLDCSGGYTINNVTINTLNNTSTCSAGGYTNYTATGTQTTSILKGSSYNLSLTVGTGSGTHSAAVWIDFNQNGLFTDAGEYFLISSTIRASSTTNVSIPIPSNALSGSTRMRVRYSNIASVTSTTSCVISGTYGETEDYTITLVTPTACVTPTAQPTTLSLTPSGTSIAGSFVVASPVSDNYLVVMNTSGTPPTIVNGTTYSIGGTVGAGNMVINTENENTFTATGLTPNTKYYFFIYSFNSVCTGGPLYNTISPLIGNTTTTSFSFCPSTSNVSTRYINSVQTVGNLTNMTNLNTGRPNTNGYSDYTTLPATTQIPGGGINLDITLAISRQYLRAWVDWNNDGTLTNSGAELVYTSGGILSIATSFGFVVPLGTTPGNYRLRIRSFEASQAFTPCGNLATGETEDYIITVVPDCPAIISTVIDNSRCESGTVNLVATALGSPTQFRWYNALTGGSIVGTSTTGSWTTPSISSTTNYYVTAYNGTCESLIRTKIIAKVNSSSIITVTPSTPEVCGEGNIVTIAASGDNMVDDLINENFQGGLGSLSSVIIGGAGDASTQWQNMTSTYVPNLSVWKPAISSRSIDDKFAFCTSDKNLLVNTSLESANLPTTAYTNLTLTFRQYYSYYGVPTDYAYIEVSTDNGGTWTAVRTYVEDHAIATDFESVTVDLTSYVNNANFKIRFRYNAQFCDGWAIDDVRLFGTKPMNTTFSWSAGTVDAYIDLACVTPYTNQSVTTVYIKPTPTQLSSTSWSFTASATLSNGCPVSKLVTIYNKTKQWLGTTSNWNDANNWKPVGVPDLTNCVFIPNISVIPAINYNGYAKNLTVKSTGNLTLSSTSNLTVTDFVKVDESGIFNIRDKASLIQTNNVANTGIVNIERVTQPISRLDYTYWNSPVTVASNFTLGKLSLDSPLMFSWIPTVSGGAGNWQNETIATTMDPGKGYIVRAPNTFSNTTKTPYTANFVGIPNNGTITAPISKGTLIGIIDVDAENDEWNLIGNPYPSALDAATFLNLPANVPLVDGTLYLWTHNSQPNAATIDPFYGDYVLNYTDSDYAAWNKTGGVGTAGSIAGGLGTNATTGNTPTGYIASGQSFFIRAANTMAPGTTLNATFNNSMRVGVEGKNGDFFKMNKNQKNEAIPKNVSDMERHRVWLNLTNNSGAFSQILVGYIEGATQSLDRSFDGELLGGNDVSFYSIIPDANLTIQGRALPFDQNDEVILGYNSAITGELAIRIDHLDGLFETQNIYLEDKELGVIQDLKDKPYLFGTEEGDFDDRFILRYINKTLNVQDATADNAITVFFTRSNNVLNIKNSANDNTVLSASLYNIQGRLISKWDVKEKEQSNIKIPIEDKTSAVYLVKLKTVKGIISKKIIIK